MFVMLAALETLTAVSTVILSSALTGRCRDQHDAVDHHCTLAAGSLFLCLLIGSRYTCTIASYARRLQLTQVSMTMAPHILAFIYSVSVEIPSHH